MQNNLLKIKMPIIVEGKYDKMRLKEVACANIITTEGFRIFNSKEKRALLLTLAKKSKIIVLTDSDGAGSVIRSHITSCIPKDRLIHLYIPQIEGKERRKVAPSKAGTLGVEGISREMLIKLLSPFALNESEIANESDVEHTNIRLVKKSDLYEDGLSGGEGSSMLRDLLAKEFDLPSGMSTNALLSALEYVANYDEYKKALEKLNLKKAF